MTYVCVYNADEDTEGRANRGPALDVWDGMKRKNYLPWPSTAFCVARIAGMAGRTRPR